MILGWWLSSIDPRKTEQVTLVDCSAWSHVMNSHRHVILVSASEEMVQWNLCARLLSWKLSSTRSFAVRRSFERDEGIVWAPLGSARRQSPWEGRARPVPCANAPDIAHAVRFSYSEVTWKWSASPYPRYALVAKDYSKIRRSDAIRYFFEAKIIFSVPRHAGAFSRVS